MPRYSAPPATARRRFGDGGADFADAASQPLAETLGALSKASPTFRTVVPRSTVLSCRRRGMGVVGQCCPGPSVAPTHTSDQAFVMLKVNV